MFELDHSAARGSMAVRELVVFRHDTELGCAPAHKLFDLVTVERATEGDKGPARSFGDYKIKVDTDRLPDGVTCRTLVDPSLAEKS